MKIQEGSRRRLRLQSHVVRVAVDDVAFESVFPTRFERAEFTTERRLFAAFEASVVVKALIVPITFVALAAREFAVSS